MNKVLSALLLGVASALAARAAEPTPAAQDDCAQDNLIVGPRTRDRPLPLLSGDPVHGFRLACSVPWSKLSPRNQPLAVTACFSGASLLKVANDAACGRVTGPLWVSSRWVVTSRDLTLKHDRLPVCERLETSALAATRDVSPECVPPAPELAPKPSAPSPAARPAAPPAAPTETNAAGPER